MPAAEADLTTKGDFAEISFKELPFPPLTKAHILNCSYHAWYPRYKSLTPKARLVALSPPFVAYLRADGIVLPPEPKRYPDPLTPPASDSDSDSDWDDDGEDPSQEWPGVHTQVQDTIKELGGSVVPKLNWSAPKDATWISATNSMDCRSANDIYLLLKSSDFVTHDLEQVWLGTQDESTDSQTTEPDVPYHLILRKTVPAYNPALEFRCFVRARQLLGICQRDLNYFSFLHDLSSKLTSLIRDFYEKHMQRSFPDPNFAFDVYVPPPHDRVWLIDVNPWAVRTDPLLFSWLEILTMPGPEQRMAAQLQTALNDEDDGKNDEAEDDSDEEEDIYTPEMRLVNRDDPEAYSFNTPKYSAHKLPKDVVDACNDGEAGLRDFMGTWREVVKQQEDEEKRVSAEA